MRWLLCDYGEVLSLPPTESDRAGLSAASGWEPERGDFWTAYWVDRQAYDRADLSAHEYWSRLIGRPPAGEQLKRLIELDAAVWLHPNPASVAAIRQVAADGMQLALLSNAPIEVAEAIDRLEWLDVFSRRFFSCYLRATKPDPATYLAVLAALDAQPEQVVFFDDRPDNVAAARDLGIDARQFREPAQLAEVSREG
jgi:putative hydrolase of the HAD superfamily